MQQILTGLSYNVYFRNLTKTEQNFMKKDPRIKNQESRHKIKVWMSIACIGFLSFTLMTACEKEEGMGGTSTITGKVKVREYNGNFTYLIGEYYAGDQDVYIIYGNDSVYSDKFTTSYDGTYRFEYLREGSYKVFAYSLDSAAYPLDRKIEVMKEVTITGKDQVVQVEDIIVLD